LRTAKGSELGANGRLNVSGELGGAWRSSSGTKSPLKVTRE